MPASLSHTIGSDAQRPFAIVIVSGLILTLMISLFLLPTLYVTLARPDDQLLPEEKPDENEVNAFDSPALSIRRSVATGTVALPGMNRSADLFPPHKR